jgi:hypothetical protein
MGVGCRALEVTLGRVTGAVEQTSHSQAINVDRRFLQPIRFKRIIKLEFQQPFGTIEKLIQSEGITGGR